MVRVWQNLELEFRSRDRMFLTSLRRLHLTWRTHRREKGVGYGYESPVINFRAHVECFNGTAQEKLKFIGLLIDQVASNKHLQCLSPIRQ